MSNTVARVQEDVQCRLCCRDFDLGDLLECKICRQFICDDCASVCVQCHLINCNNCCNRCARCALEVCLTCDLDTCATCEKKICKACIGAVCPTCNSDICEFCANQTLVFQTCPACDKTFCQRCFISTQDRCPNCRLSPADAKAAKLAATAKKGRIDELLVQFEPERAALMKKFTRLSADEKEAYIQVVNSLGHAKAERSFMQELNASLVKGNERLEEARSTAVEEAASNLQSAINAEIATGECQRAFDEIKTAHAELTLECGLANRLLYLERDRNTHWQKYCSDLKQFNEKLEKKYSDSQASCSDLKKINERLATMYSDSQVSRQGTIDVIRECLRLNDITQIHSLLSAADKDTASATATTRDGDEKTTLSPPANRKKARAE